MRHRPNTLVCNLLLKAIHSFHITYISVGYVLEYKSEDDVDWQEWNGIVRHRPRQNEYKATVRNLKESTEYFFRLRVVGKGDKRGGPGPELKAITKCGRKFLTNLKHYCHNLEIQHQNNLRRM